MLMLTVLAALAAGPTSFAHAQSTPPTITFVTLDGVELSSTDSNSGARVRLTGVVLGETVARTVVLSIFSRNSSNTYVFDEAQHARCERLLLLAMARPGAFRVTITTVPVGGGAGPVDAIRSCALSRAP